MGYRARRSFDKFDKFGGPRNPFMQEPTGMLPGDDVGNRKVHKPIINPPDDIGNRRQMERLEKTPPDDIGNHVERAPTHELSMSLFDNHGKLRRPPKAAERIGRYLVGGVNPLVSGASMRYSPPPSPPVVPTVPPAAAHAGPNPPSSHMPMPMMPMMPMESAMMPPDALEPLEGMEDNTIFIPPTGLPMDAMPPLPMMPPIATPPAPVRSRFDRNRNKQDPRSDVRADPRFDPRFDARAEMHMDHDGVMNAGASAVLPAPPVAAVSPRGEEISREYREQKTGKKHDKQQNQQNQQGEKFADKQHDKQHEKQQDKQHDKQHPTSATSPNTGSSAASSAAAGKSVEVESPEKKLQRFIDLDDDDRFDYILKSEPAQKAQKAQEVAADIVRLCGRKATVTSQIIDDDGKSRVLIVLDEHGAADEIPTERRHETIDEPLFSLDSFPALLTLNYFVNKSVNRYPDDRIRLAVLPAKNIDLYLKLLEKHRAERVQKAVVASVSAEEAKRVVAETVAVSPSTTAHESTVAVPVVVSVAEPVVESAAKSVVVAQEPTVILTQPVHESTAVTSSNSSVAAASIAAETPSTATETTETTETTKTTKTTKTTEEKQEKPNDASSSVAAATSVEGTPAPRRRGRPPKAKPVVEDTQITLPTTPITAVQTEPVVEKNAEVESKPLQIEAQPKATATVTVIPAVSTESVPANTIDPVVGTVVETVVEIAPAPRRRGRPPKVKPVLETATEAVVEVVSAPAAEVVAVVPAPVVETAPVAEIVKAAEVAAPETAAPEIAAPAPSDFAPVIAFVEIETAAPRPRRRRKTEE